MNKLILLVLLLQVALFSDNVTACKKCHPAIYAEFYSSMHSKSSPLKDKVHGAVWDLHPSKAKNDYSCAKCHTPNAKGLSKTDGSISCVTCHTISSINEHETANENVYAQKPKTFYAAKPGKEKEIVTFHQNSDIFGLNKTASGSPYHTIDYTNELFYSGKVCMGCHSHKQNTHGFELCKTPMKGALDTKQNCITCHMPQVSGSATSIVKTPTHTYHGFTGVYTDPQLLETHIDIKFEKIQEGFVLTLINHAPHDLLLHPLRIAELKTTLVRQNKPLPLQTYRFVKVIGKGGKPSMPWEAVQEVKNTMLKANESRKITFDTLLKNGDRIDVNLGFYPVNPKAANTLKLEDTPEATEYKLLKKIYFIVK